jgi:YfiH family protein
MLTIGPLNDLPGLRHGFLTRQGGVSEGLYSSLNCGLGSGDDPAKVAENRRRALAKIELDGASLVTAYQVHSAKAVVVERPWAQEDRPQVDGLVTRVPGLALGVLTADCVPVLLADVQAGVVGAAHAGWHGALGGVLESTVEAMEGLGAARGNLVAGIGPAIAQRSYEVGPDYPAPFLAEDEDNRDLFCPSRRQGHFHFDLKGYVARRLARLGLASVQALPCDTCAEDRRFFSYRRACLRGETDYGRGLSVICLEP